MINIEFRQFEKLDFYHLPAHCVTVGDYIVHVWMLKNTSVQTQLPVTTASQDAATQGKLYESESSSIHCCTCKTKACYMFQHTGPLLQVPLPPVRGFK